MLLAGSENAESGNLGIEFVRAGGTSAFGLAGGGGDFGLLLEPLGVLFDSPGKRDQANADLTFSLRVSCRPLSTDVDSADVGLVSTCGNTGPVDSAASVVGGASVANHCLLMC